MTTPSAYWIFMRLCSNNNNQNNTKRTRRWWSALQMFVFPANNARQCSTRTSKSKLPWELNCCRCTFDPFSCALYAFTRLFVGAHRLFPRNVPSCDVNVFRKWLVVGRWQQRIEVSVLALLGTWQHRLIIVFFCCHCLWCAAFKKMKTWTFECTTSVLKDNASLQTFWP